MRRTALVWLVACLLAGIQQVAVALTLEEYFDAALARSEVIATQGELIRQAEERHRQANAALLPTISGVASYTWQDSGARDPNTSPDRQPLARLTANQPLFRGFREFAALRESNALVDAQSADYQQARTQLFNDVAQNFYDVLTLEQEIKNLDEQVVQYDQRLKELQERVRIGRSRTGETLTVQSTASTVEATVEQRKAELNTARETFAFLSGMATETVLSDTQTVPDDLNSLATYLDRVALRPDVNAAQQRLRAAQENIKVARGAHLPSLDLNANRYLERTGPLEDVTWDVQLALTVPLYAGGSVQSQVRLAESQATQSELAVSQTKRRAEQEIRSLYQSVLIDRSQLAALAKATEAALKNYTTQQRDYRLGLVTNLDVLQALAVYQDNQRALDRARYTAKLDYLKLQAAAFLRPGPLGTAKP